MRKEWLQFLFSCWDVMTQSTLEKVLEQSEYYQRSLGLNLQTKLDVQSKHDALRIQIFIATKTGPQQNDMHGNIT